MHSSRCHPEASPYKTPNVTAWLCKPVKRSDLLEAIGKGTNMINVEPLPHTPTAPAPCGRRVLLAEDDESIQILTTALLHKRGHTVAVANTGKEALAALEKEPFDVVLMDVRMPEVDGLEATAIIRKREEATGEHLIIIALTAAATREQRERCLEAGMDGHISKPFEPEDLYQAVESAASGSSMPPGTGC
jgi:two-component system sensor histidine kinase/response regulator